MKTVVLERFSLNRAAAEKALAEYQLKWPLGAFHLRTDKGAQGMEYVVVQEVT